MKSVDVNGFKREMNGEYLILDVRTPEEFGDGHIDGAMLIPVHELESRLTEIHTFREKKVLVYCRSGARSMVAVGILNENGYQVIVNLNGGYIAWSRFLN